MRLISPNILKFLIGFPFWWTFGVVFHVLAIWSRVLTRAFSSKFNEQTFLPDYREQSKNIWRNVEIINSLHSLQLTHFSYRLILRVWKSRTFLSNITCLPSVSKKVTIRISKSFHQTLQVFHFGQKNVLVSTRLNNAQNFFGNWRQTCIAKKKHEQDFHTLNRKNETSMKSA